MKNILMLTCINLTKKKKFNHHDSESYWPTSIKDTINWFTFITIMGHTENLMETNKGLILSLLKVFSMFELLLIGDKDKLDVIAIRCINVKEKQFYIYKIKHFKK